MITKLEEINSLVETMRLEAQGEFMLLYDLEAHALRMLKSALELGFKLKAKPEEFVLLFYNQIKNKIQYQFHKQLGLLNDDINNNAKEIYKLRFIMHRSGMLKIDIEEYKRDLKKAWKVKILDEKEFHIESSNPIWQHKFLPRPEFSKYFEQGYNEVIWRDENGNICEGSFTAIIFDNNKSPKANTLPSISLSKISNLKFVETKGLEKDFILTNSLIGKKKISHDHLVLS